MARRLASVGASLGLHHHRPHDSGRPWGADDLDRILASVRDPPIPGAELHDLPGDLAEPGAPEELADRAVEAAGPPDVQVCDHARSGGDGSLADITAEQLDGHRAPDARSVLLTKAFAAQHEPARSRTPPRRRPWPGRGRLPPLVTSRKPWSHPRTTGRRI
ncbi:hypothetical protein [Streptomyces sp. NPDC005012]|uniref:hypothetical protein n=1 Tax=Streptomyces sp. NPDC005012 TaxID=3154558 RepID=UPI0033BE4B12